MESYSTVNQNNSQTPSNQPERTHSACNCNLCYFMMTEGFMRGTFSDITVKILNREFKLHKIILTRCTYFNVLLAGNWKESDASELSIDVDDENITADAVGVAFKSLYTEKIDDITETNQFSILATAEFLQLESLTKSAVEFILNHLSHRTIVRACLFAERYKSCLELEKGCRHWLLNNLHDIKRIDLFWQIPPKLFTSLIASTDLWIHTEFKRYKLASEYFNAYCYWSSGSSSNLKMSTPSSPSLSTSSSSDINNHLQVNNNNTNNNNIYSGNNSPSSSPSSPKSNSPASPTTTTTDSIPSSPSLNKRRRLSSNSVELRREALNASLRVSSKLSSSEIPSSLGGSFSLNSLQNSSQQFTNSFTSFDLANGNNNSALLLRKEAAPFLEMFRAVIYVHMTPQELSQVREDGIVPSSWIQDMYQYYYHLTTRSLTPEHRTGKYAYRMGFEIYDLDTLKHDDHREEIHAKYFHFGGSRWKISIGVAQKNEQLLSPDRWLFLELGRVGWESSDERHSSSLPLANINKYHKVAYSAIVLSSISTAKHVYANSGSISMRKDSKDGGYWLFEIDKVSNYLFPSPVSSAKHMRLVLAIHDLE